MFNKYMTANNSTMDFSYDIKSENNFVTNIVEVTNLQIELNIEFNYNQSDALEFMFHAFVNQRKMYRQYIAETEYEEDIITEDVFDKIEQSCAITLKKNNRNNMKNKLLYLHDTIEKYYPEELEYMNNDDLCDIFGISKYDINELLKK